MISRIQQAIILCIILVSTHVFGKISSKLSNQFSLGTVHVVSEKKTELKNIYLRANSQYVVIPAAMDGIVYQMILSDLHGRVLDCIRNPHAGNHKYPMKLRPGCYYIIYKTRTHIYTSSFAVLP